MSITSDEVRNSALAQIRLREGYLVNEVDRFLERVAVELDNAHGSLTSAQVRRVKFTPTRFRAAYDMREVDDLLDRVDAELQQREARRRGHA